MKRHATGLTIALTALFAVALSFAPVPDRYKPLASIAQSEEPLTALAKAVLPSRSKKPTPMEDPLGGAVAAANALDQDAHDPGREAAELALEAELDAAEAQAPATRDPAESQPFSPATTLGAAESRAVRRLERLVKKLEAKHVDLEQSCRVTGADGECERYALDDFFEGLEALQRGERAQPVRIVHLGDSQIASDYIADTVRRRLELRYGSGGPGFLFVDRPTRGAGRKVRTGEATEGWEIVKLTDKERSGLLGFSGVRFTARDRQRAEFGIGPARHAELAFVAHPKGGDVEVSVDGKFLTKVLTRLAETDVGYSRVELPEGARTLSLTAQGGEVSLFGVTLETGTPGVVYDTVGLPGALYDVYLRAQEQVFAAQLARRDPSLVIVMLGGNEAYEIGRGWKKLDEIERNAQALLARVQKAAPQSACLLIAPMDAGTRTISREIEPRQHTEAVGKVVRKVALANGCAFWDLYSAMGGKGAAGRWYELGLFNEDLVHPRPRGAEVLGHLLDFALERARASRPKAAAPRPTEPAGLLDPTGAALGATFAKLSALSTSKQDAERLTIVQLGASHTASHMFTDTVRAELAKSFGFAGRGYVAVGRPSERLSPSKVKRELRGDWQIPDARGAPVGEVWGLNGNRAVAQPGASTAITFGHGEDGGDAPATLSLYYLDAPGRGRMVVRIDGREVAALDAPAASHDSGAPSLDPAAPSVPGAAERDGKLGLREAEPRVPRAGRAADPLPRPDPLARPASAAPPVAAPQAASAAVSPASASALTPALSQRVARVLQFAVKGTSHVIEVENAGPGTLTVFGASLEKDRGGVVLDALGLPGATATVADGWDKAAFTDQLRTRKADLFILFFGTNESAIPDLDPEEVRRSNRSLIATFRAASPDADCLIIGPTDRLDTEPDGRIVESPSGDVVMAAVRDVAESEGCAFWSARAAMGGPRSMLRWRGVSPPLGHSDGVHLTQQGYEVLAQQFADDLISAWRAAKDSKAAPSANVGGP